MTATNQTTSNRPLVGIGIWGFLTWTGIKWIIGKKGDISLALLIIDLFAILALILE